MNEDGPTANEFSKCCDLCDIGTKFNNIKVFENHLLTHQEYLQTVKLSNNTEDYCRTKCKICGKAYQLSNLRTHVRGVHDIAITEYKQRYGLLDITDKYHHKCKLCDTIILFDADDVKNHLQRRHKIQHHDYNAKYIIFRKQQFKQQRDLDDIKSCDTKQTNLKNKISKKKDEKNTLDKELTTMIKEMLNSSDIRKLTQSQ